MVFPESSVPGYPRGFDFGAVVGSRFAAGHYSRPDIFSLEVKEQPEIIREG